MDDDENNCPIGQPWLSKDQSVEDQDDQPDNIQEASPAVELENFRKEWEQELTQNKQNGSGNINSSSTSRSEIDKENRVETVDKVEEEARQLFVRAVSLERHGDFYEACRYYKRAFQLVPDIEKRVSSEIYPHPQQQSQQQQQRQDPDKENISPDEGDSFELRSMFLDRIQENGWIWLTKDIEGLDRNKLHMSDMPEEVLKYLVRWVVSKDVDVRSLDSLSRVSIGFYVICRDEALWRDICSRIWGNELRQPPGFSSYREMYFTRSHPCFDGCYISKVTYVRSGENSFQDQSYRPWHVVEYYRYVRFLPNQTVLFLTTSETPTTAVHSLRDFNLSKGQGKVLQGRYTLTGQIINIQCTAIKKPNVMTYDMEFSIGNAKNNRFNWVLKWNNYSVTFNSSEQSQFDMEPNKFPPMVFSRVKSFNRMSEYVL